MALDKVNRDWKAAVNKGPNGRRIPVRGARVALIDFGFWDVYQYPAAAACYTGGTSEKKKGSRKVYLYGPKSEMKDYVGLEATPGCAGVDVEKWVVLTQQNPKLRGLWLIRSGGKRVRRRDR